MTLEFRRPLLQEAETMAALHVQCWREAYADILPAELMASFSVGKRLPMWQMVIPESTRFVLGAFDEGKPVGFVISGSTNEKHIENQDGHLWAIYVAAAYYRNGIGRMLVAEAASDWLAHGGTSLTLGVLAENTRARMFYESLGARAVKSGTYVWDGYPLADLIYIFDNLPALIP